MNSRLNDIGAWVFEAAVILGLWVGTLSYLRPIFHAHFGVGSFKANALLISLAGITVFGLWRGVSLAGPLSMPVSEMTWSRSSKMIWLRLMTVFATAAIIAAAVISLLIAFASPAIAVSVWVSVGAVGASVGAVPVLAAIQRLDGDRFGRGVSTALACGMIIAVLLFLLNASSTVMIIGGVVSVGVVLTGFLVNYLRSRRHLGGIPRWSLIRASEFTDAVIMSTTMLDSTRAQVYSDQRGITRRLRIPNLPQTATVELVWRTFARTVTTSVPRLLLTAIFTAFTYRILGPSTGIAVACLGVIAASNSVALTWADWDSSANMSRMFATIMTYPSMSVFAGLIGGVALVSVPVVASASWNQKPHLWVVISLLATVSMMLERARDAAAGKNVTEGGYMLTPDGLIVPMGMLSTISAPWALPSTAVIVGAIFGPVWALGILGAIVTWGLWHRLRVLLTSANRASL
ncbi:MAG: hypothetical protein Q4P71_09150 [Actinomycetaceae bacterium]|nr:hypothetical protein [Actinomycetaceae bacterium]